MEIVRRPRLVSRIPNHEAMFGTSEHHRHQLAFNNDGDGNLHVGLTQLGQRIHLWTVASFISLSTCLQMC